MKRIKWPNQFCSWIK